jgi:hypothetical protein
MNLKDPNYQTTLLDIDGIADAFGLVGDKKSIHQKIYYMISRKEIPAFKLAGRWYCRKKSLVDRLSFLEKTN